MGALKASILVMAIDLNSIYDGICLTCSFDHIGFTRHSKQYETNSALLPSLWWSLLFTASTTCQQSLPQLSCFNPTTATEAVQSAKEEVNSPSCLTLMLAVLRSAFHSF